jgi:endonuclease/exonuclease/phosphatase (EEP) superfamily protein YafD
VETAAVNVIFQKDDDGSRKEFPFALKETRGAYQVWESNFSMDAPGLFFYYFTITGRTGTFRLFKQGNDTNKNRLCAYAILKNLETGTETLYASCHFCTRPNAEMQELSVTQAKTLTSTLTSLAKGRTIVVGGDFNAKMDTPTYKHITETAEFFDTRETAYQKTNLDLNSARIWGKVQTWFDGKDKPIDHIFYLGNTIVADEWQVLTDTYTMQGNVTFDRDKIGINYDLSDHMAIYVKFRDLPE